MDLMPRHLGGQIDASDEKATAEAELNAKRREEEAKAVVQSIMSTPQGRRWIWNKLAHCNIFATTFVSGDTHASAFNEGARNVGLMLLTEVIRADPHHFTIMQSEAANG